jgi:hypothetical protein
MTAGEGGSPSSGFSFLVWRSGNRLRRGQNPTRFTRFRGPPEVRSYKSRTTPFVQEAVFATKTANYLIWLAPFTWEGSQVQTLPRPPSRSAHDASGAGVETRKRGRLLQSQGPKARLCRDAFSPFEWPAVAKPRRRSLRGRPGLREEKSASLVSARATPQTNPRFHVDGL